jgi:thimet oligopeptidase
MLRSHPASRYFLVTTTILLAFVLVLGTGCMQSTTPAPAATTPAGHGALKTLPYTGNYTPGEITRLTANATETANASLAAIVAIPESGRTFDNTFVAFDRVMTDYSDKVLTPGLMGYVYPDPAIAAEGMDAETATNVFSNMVYSRQDMYDALKSVSPRTESEARLYNVTIKEFEHNGLGLEQDRLDEVVTLNQNLTALESEFTANLNSDNTVLVFTADELQGIPNATLSSFERADNGSYLVSLKYPDYIAVMTYADNSSTRKTMYMADSNIAAENNTKLLEEAIVLREQIARELGYATWADYKTEGRMAGNASTVMGFLDSLKEPLKEKNQEEMTGLLAIKKESEPDATFVNPWDVTCLFNIQKERQYAYDQNEVKEYFPADTVIPKMFGIFGTLYGIRFDEVKDAAVWAPDVRLYRVSNTTDNATAGYLYLDLYPRDGKYGSFMESTNIKGRIINGTYSVPVVTVVANCPEPSGRKPSLLTMYDLESLFHETGHAMHDLLTTAPYGSLSGTSVAWDFVETPSQTMEEWAWDPEVLVSLSGRYTNSSEKLPRELADRVVAARSVGVGSQYSSQLAYALEDLRFHTATGPVNVTEVWNQTYTDVKGHPAVPGIHQPATFSHLMGGYDAGYYGYLWSKVYAITIVEKFKEDGMTNKTTGMEFRDDILSQGNMQDANTLLENFLGQKPGTGAFYEWMGISVPQTT